MPDNKKHLAALEEELLNVLERLNQIRPVQFLDWEGGYVYNILGLLENEEDDRIYVCVSGEYDNLPAHEYDPLKNSRGRIIGPNSEWRPDA